MAPCKRARDKNGRFLTAGSKSACLPHHQLASTKVLTTTELSEAILAHLPVRDLLLAQRVSKSWRTLITTSLRLRRALFLEPGPHGSINYIDWRLDDKDCYTPSRADLGLGPAIRSTTGIPLRYAAHWGRTRSDAGRWTVRVNPLLAAKFEVLRADGLFWPARDTELVRQIPAMRYAHASWRKMYFTQPPVKCLAIEWDSERGRDDAWAGKGWGISVIGCGLEEKALRMAALWELLKTIGRPTWILGRELWEETEEQVVEAKGDLAMVIALK